MSSRREDFRSGLEVNLSQSLATRQQLIDLVTKLKEWIGRMECQKLAQILTAGVRDFPSVQKQEILRIFREISEKLQNPDTAISDLLTYQEHDSVWARRLLEDYGFFVFLHQVEFLETLETKGLFALMLRRIMTAVEIKILTTLEKIGG